MKNKRKQSRRGYAIKRRYGISFEQWQQMLTDQHNQCKICGKEGGLTVSGRSNLHVDHCHATGKVRGLLCARCNLLIGYMEADGWMKQLWEAENYLEDNS